MSKNISEKVKFIEFLPDIFLCSALLMLIRSVRDGIASQSVLDLAIWLVCKRYSRVCWGIAVARVKRV